MWQPLGGDYEVLLIGMKFTGDKSLVNADFISKLKMSIKLLEQS